MLKIDFIPTEEMNSILPFLELLNKGLDKEILIDRLASMKSHNYKCVGIYDDGKLIGISGLWILYKHYIGKHIEPDDVVVHPDFRGNGIGEKLMSWIHDYAIENGCNASELNVYVSNPKGIRFWSRLGYNIIGFHMRKSFRKEYNEHH